jgi:superfamily II DNA or RNA helicase
VIELIQSKNSIAIRPWLPLLEKETSCMKSVRKQEKGRVSYVQKQIKLHSVAEGDAYGLTFGGLMERITQALNHRGIPYTLTDMRQPLPEVQLDYPDVVYRTGQRDCLLALTSKHRGVVRCPPGWGKSFVIEMFVRMNTDKRILVTTTRKDVLEQLKPRIGKRCPGHRVDLCNGSKKPKEDAQVIVCSDKSLHHINPDWPEVVIYDEVHNASANVASHYLMRLLAERFYGFSATPQRTDGSYKVIEALFGPIIADISHSEAVDSQAIVPMQVRIVRNYGDAMKHFSSSHFLNRDGIWRNKHRNEAVADAARRLESEGFEKVLIMTATTEHAYILRLLLPDYTVVHAGIDEEQRQKFIKNGLLLDDEDPNTNPAWLREWFANGDLTKVIATTKWREGVDFPDLRVIVRADAQSSFNTSIQIGGRTSRLSSGKEMGVVVDFADMYGPELERRASKRRENYLDQGWQVVEW